MKDLIALGPRVRPKDTPSDRGGLILGSMRTHRRWALWELNDRGVLQVELCPLKVSQVEAMTPSASECGYI